MHPCERNHNPIPENFIAAGKIINFALIYVLLLDHLTASSDLECEPERINDLCRLSVNQKYEIYVIDLIILGSTLSRYKLRMIYALLLNDTRVV